ncbi:MAG TPA: proton-conducting transporter membrane subunit [Gaiellaceae bacterium]
MIWIPLVVAVPFLGAATLVVVGHALPRRASDVIGIAGAGTAVVLAAILLARVGAGTSVYWFGGWTPRAGSFPLGIAFAVDTFGATLALFVLTLVLAALVYSWRYMEETHHLYEVLMLLFGGAMAGFALSGDLFNMFVLFELMSVAAFALAAYNVEETTAIQGAFNFAVTNTLGALFVLTGIALVYGRTGSLNLAEIGRRLGSDGRHDGLVIVAFGLIVCGFLVKAAIVPFHFWLADAYAIAPAPVCLLFAAVMSDLGIYGIARVYWVAFDGVLGQFEDPLRDVLLGVGAVTAVLGAVMAVLQRHLKRLLAYATISDLGCFLIGVALLTPDGVAGTGAWVVAHGLAKGSLFLAGGILLVTKGSIDEIVLHGKGRDRRWSALAWAAAALALAGPPFLGTWPGHALVDDAATQLGRGWIPVLLAAVTIVSTAAIVRAGLRVFLGLGPRTDRLLSPEPDEAPPAQDEPPSLALMQAVAVTLAVASLALGAVTSLGAHAKEAAHRFTDGDAYRALVLDHTPLPPAPAAHWATSAQGVVWGLVCLAGSFALALGLLYRSRVVPAAVFRPLKAVHSGHVGDYVAWLTFGVAVIGGAFALALR